MSANRDEEERPRWREADDDDEPREWEVEPEEEKSDKKSVLGETAPVARVVFFAILATIALGGILLLIRALGSYFGR